MCLVRCVRVSAFVCDCVVCVCVRVVGCLRVIACGCSCVVLSLVLRVWLVCGVLVCVVWFVCGG